MLMFKLPPIEWGDILSKSHWHLWVWLGTGAAFLFNELFAIAEGRKYATFTYIVKKGVPRWLVAAILGWLTYHFLIES